ncbi:MAG: hypothetical protein WC806_03550 [Candidatus Gracilibacteria bacterium]|jgi:hypothetical protein
MFSGDFFKALWDLAEKGDESGHKKASHDVMCEPTYLQGLPALDRIKLESFERDFQILFDKYTKKKIPDNIALIANKLGSYCGIGDFWNTVKNVRKTILPFLHIENTDVEESEETLYEQIVKLVTIAANNTLSAHKDILIEIINKIIFSYEYGFSSVQFKDLLSQSNLLETALKSGKYANLFIGI